MFQRCICQTASKFVDRFKQSARTWCRRDRRRTTLRRNV